MARERWHVHYSGRVQGVGFRLTARHLSRDFQVGGYVRNLPDGRVELLAEGEPTEVTGFLNAIRRELGDKIRDAQEEREPPSDPPFVDFDIRY